MSGANHQKTTWGTKLRDDALGVCYKEAAKPKPLDGTFTIKSLTPRKDANGLVDKIDIVVTANSKTPWVIGTTGHQQFGDLWVDLEATNFVGENGLSTPKKTKYLFSIRGIAAGTAALMTPHPGMHVAQGTQDFLISVSPMPRIQLKGVRKMFSMDGGLFQPGKLRCWYDNPEISAKVNIVTRNGFAAQAFTTGPIWGVPRDTVSLPKQGGFNEGVINPMSCDL